MQTRCRGSSDRKTEAKLTLRDHNVATNEQAMCGVVILLTGLLFCARRSRLSVGFNVR
jgi:hypothetical protein